MSAWAALSPAGTVTGRRLCTTSRRARPLAATRRTRRSSWTPRCSGSAMPRRPSADTLSACCATASRARTIKTPSSKSSTSASNSWRSWQQGYLRVSGPAAPKSWFVSRTSGKRASSTSRHSGRDGGSQGRFATDWSPRTPSTITPSPTPSTPTAYVLNLMKPLTLNLTPTVSATPRVTFFIPKPSHALPDPPKTPTYKLPDHPCAARDAQVEWLVAAPPALRGASRLPWPKPSPQFLLQWEARHEAHGSLSTGYKATQERMLFLGDVPMQHRFARFEAECHIRRLAPTTAMTYYN